MWSELICKFGVNQQVCECGTGNTVLQSLLQQLELLKPGVAVALNNKVISKSEWSLTNLQADDQIQVFQAIAGG